jgi:hypothetical protein
MCNDFKQKVFVNPLFFGVTLSQINGKLNVVITDDNDRYSGNALPIDGAFHALQSPKVRSPRLMQMQARPLKVGKAEVNATERPAQEVALAIAKAAGWKIEGLNQLPNDIHSLNFQLIEPRRLFEVLADSTKLEIAFPKEKVVRYSSNPGRKQIDALQEKMSKTKNADEAANLRHKLLFEMPAVFTEGLERDIGEIALQHANWAITQRKFDIAQRTLDIAMAQHRRLDFSVPNSIYLAQAKFYLEQHPRDQLAPFEQSQANRVLAIEVLQRSISESEKAGIDTPVEAVVLLADTLRDLSSINNVEDKMKSLLDPKKPTAPSKEPNLVRPMLIKLVQNNPDSIPALLALAKDYELSRESKNAGEHFDRAMTLLRTESSLDAKKELTDRYTRHADLLEQTYEFQLDLGRGAKNFDQRLIHEGRASWIRHTKEDLSR